MSNMLVFILVTLAVVRPWGVFVSADTYIEHAKRILNEVPLVDGHNDLAWRYMYSSDGPKRVNISKVDLTKNMSGQNYRQNPLMPSHTDIPRLRQGMVGAQFWSIFSFCESQYKDGVQKALEVIDTMYRVFDKYDDTFQFVTSSSEIMEAKKNGKIASLFGLEGGHMISQSMSVLRMFYRLGVRYLTLTWNCNTPWADSNRPDKDTLTTKRGGLTRWGQDLILEMNRMGMLVDLSHVSEDSMHEALDITRAPVIFSHSSAYDLCPNPRNVPEGILHRVQMNGGIVMVNFYNYFVNCTEENRFDYGSPRPASMDQVIDHMEYIKMTAGRQSVGIGGDFDGIEVTPDGLEDVSKYVSLVARMLERGWTESDVKLAVGMNMIRVLSEVERLRDRLSEEEPLTEKIPDKEIPNTSCKSPSFEDMAFPIYSSPGQRCGSISFLVETVLVVIAMVMMYK